MVRAHVGVKHADNENEKGSKGIAEHIQSSEMSKVGKRVGKGQRGHWVRLAERQVAYEVSIGIRQQKKCSAQTERQKQGSERTIEAHGATRRKVGGWPTYKVRMWPSVHAILRNEQANENDVFQPLYFIRAGLLL